MVPFQAFGLRDDSGWFRISVGRGVAGRHRRRHAARARGPVEVLSADPVAAAGGRRPAVLPLLALAVVLRVGLFPFAENKHGDAPMRALIAERMVLEPASAAEPRTYCQFGPLHTTLMRPFIALDRVRGALVAGPVAAGGNRGLLSLPGARLGGWWGHGGRRSRPSRWRVSPLHVQTSTTAGSEALYLLLWVACMERLLAALASRRTATFALAGLLGIAGGADPL